MQIKKNHLHCHTGVTLLELLVVIAIIGILVLIGLPNGIQIIRMNRIRTSSNDLLSKIRYGRSLAIKARRELTMSVNKTAASCRFLGSRLSAEFADDLVNSAMARISVCQSPTQGT